MDMGRDHTDLLRDFRRGKEAAVRRLYDLHYQPLCYFADSLVHNQGEAEDIAVETFLKLLHRKQEFESLAGIKSFLYAVARNACYDQLRKKKTRDKANRELTYLAEPDHLFGEQEAITARVLQFIYAEVENLPSQRRQVFKSFFMEGKSTTLIAAEMGISPQTVLNQKTKALQTLRLALYREGLFSAVLFLHCLLLISAQHRA